MSKKPFEEDDDEDQLVAPPKVGLKKISSQKSIFESMPKKPTQEDLNDNVKQVQNRVASHTNKAADLVLQFKKAMEDKVLFENKSIFAHEFEKEILTNMVTLAIDINNDPNEKEGMGSLSWITLLLRNCFAQRDKINKLEYLISQQDKKIEEIILALDSKKNSE
jgi:hypothetical protein